jgi:NADH-ubiquinone oxidoreductase chain 4L
VQFICPPPVIFFNLWCAVKEIRIISLPKNKYKKNIYFNGKKLISQTYTFCIVKWFIFIHIVMNLSLILFLVGILGFVLNRKNIILMLISIEIMLLAITFLILLYSFSFDDILGQVFAVYIIAIAGAESAIGLGILVAFYRLRGSIEIDYK